MRARRKKARGAGGPTSDGDSRNQDLRLGAAGAASRPGAARAALAPGDVWALHALAARGAAMVASQRAGAARARSAAARLCALAGRDAGAAPRGRARMVAPPHGHRRARLGRLAGPRATGYG